MVTDEVPVPRVLSSTRPRILEGFELKPLGRKPNVPTIGEKAFSISRDQMRHRVTLPAMTVQPEATVHCEDHPVTTTREFAVRWDSDVAHTSRLHRSGVPCHDPY